MGVDVDSSVSLISFMFLLVESSKAIIVFIMFSGVFTNILLSHSLIHFLVHNNEVVVVGYPSDVMVLLR